MAKGVKGWNGRERDWAGGATDSGPERERRRPQSDSRIPGLTWK